MNFDYSKVVNFLFGKSVNKLNKVLECVINDGFMMLDVNVPHKMILLEKQEKKYVLTIRENRILIFPDNYRSVCFSDDFGEVIEIIINEDGDVVVTRLFNNENPNGVVATTSVWKYKDNMYSEVVGRVMFVEKDKFEVIENQETIEMFISSYYRRRTGFLSDLYYDFDAFRKNNFLPLKFVERVMVNDGFTFEDFGDLYKKHNDKILTLVKEKGKPSLF